jgi:hypothetical protein
MAKGSARKRGSTARKSTQAREETPPPAPSPSEAGPTPRKRLRFAPQGGLEAIPEPTPGSDATGSHTPVRPSGEGVPPTQVITDLVTPPNSADRDKQTIDQLTAASPVYSE